MVNLLIIFLLLDDSVKIKIFEQQIELYYPVFWHFMISFTMWFYFERHSYGYDPRLVDELEKRRCDQEISNEANSVGAKSIEAD